MKNCKKERTQHSKKECIKYLKSKLAKIKNLEVCNANIKNLKSGKITTENLESKNLIVTENTTLNNVSAENTKTVNLEVTTINGRNLACEKSFTNVNSSLITTNPLEYPQDSGFSQKVWNGLVAETNKQKQELEDRLQCGRLQVRYIQREFGCEPCPPNELQDCIPFCDPPAPPGEVCECPEESGDCPRVPLEIFGIRSVSPVNQIICGPSLEEQATQLISTLSYNLDVINISGTLATRVVSILVQAGYLDQNGDFVYEELDFGNRQFAATLDTTFGEKYTGTITLDSAFMEEISSSPNSSAIVQLVVFKEQGVDIDVRNQAPRSRSVTSRQVLESGPVDASFLGRTVGGQLQWANIYSNYSSTTTEIQSLSSRFELAQSAQSTQWVMGWSFVGPTPTGGGAGGYFGINTNANGEFLVLGSIFNVALSAAAEQTYVTPVRFGGEGVGWSLRITQENISNFPIEVFNQYSVSINRENVTEEGVVWGLTIRNITNDTTVKLGTITTSPQYQFIRNTGIYQFSEYFGPGAPAVTCPTIPLSIIDWTFPQVNEQPAGSTNYIQWTPPPQHCGEFRIEANVQEETVNMSFGCTSC